MDQRAQYLLQVFEKIGGPLVAAVTQTSADDAQANAQKIAELLTKSVKLGIDISAIANLSGAQGDSVRVALTALSSPLLAAHYKNSKQIPEDADIAQITNSLKAVLSFSENFTPDSENTERLEALAASGVGLDAHQMSVQFIQAFVPVINVIGAFSFGQPEQKLIMDVCVRLTAEASNLRKAVLQDLSEIEQKRADLAFLKTLADIYTACHGAETARLAGTDVPASDGLVAVWSSFELRLAMVQALSHSIIHGSDGASPVEEAGAPAAPDPTPPQQGAPEEEKAQKAPKIEAKVEMGRSPGEEKPADVPPVADAPASEPPPSAGANPMSMFAKKKPEDEPPKEPPPAAVEAPAEEAKPETPAVDSSDEGEKDSSGDGGGDGGGPMSFFTKKD